MEQSQVFASSALEVSGEFPIHLACAGKQSLEVLKYLVDQYPINLQKEDKNGNLPIHRLCSSIPSQTTPSQETVKYIAKEKPMGMLHKNKDGWLPLDYAASNDESFCFVATLCPQALN